MPTSSVPTRNAIEALRSVQAQGRYLLSAAEFARMTGREDASAATKLAIARLVRSRQLASLGKQRPSSLLIIPPEHEHFGAPPVAWWLDDFLRVAEPDYYVALLSAAKHWGSAHFAQQATQVMVARRRRDITVGRLTIQFVSKLHIERTPVEVVSRSVVAPFRVSTREATLLDLARHQTDVGGFENVARIARDLAPKITDHGMHAALDALNMTAVAQRLGFILEHIARPRSQVIADWLTHRRIQKQALEPTLDHETHESSEWGIEFTPRQMAALQEVSS